MPVITYDMPFIDRKSRLAMFGAVFYVVLAGSLAYMMSERGGGLSTFQLVLIPVALLVPLANALYTVRQLHTLERRSLLTQPAASQLFRAALTQLSAGYATVVLLLPVPARARSWMKVGKLVRRAASEGHPAPYFERILSENLHAKGFGDRSVL